ncbi:MAG: CoA-binding protein [Holophagales bacterium]|nr:CoA-binding protein [Holophagales bacterium]
MTTVGVIGMKDDAHAGQPAVDIPLHLRQLGVRVIPINPEIESSLGEKAYPTVADLPERVPMYDVFRRAANVPRHADEILALPPERRPDVVWLQSGIRHDESARRLAEAGIDVVQDRCLGVYASLYRRG